MGWVVKTSDSRETLGGTFGQFYGGTLGLTATFVQFLDNFREVLLELLGIFTTIFGLFLGNL